MFEAVSLWRGTFVRMRMFRTHSQQRCLVSCWIVALDLFSWNPRSILTMLEGPGRYDRITFKFPSRLAVSLAPYE